MSSFIDKLNRRGVGTEKSAPGVPQAPGTAAPTQATAPENALQVDVDVQQSLVDIIVIAPLPGVAPEDLRISIEGQNDVVVIQGAKKRPDVITAKGEGAMKGTETTMFLAHECTWGTFFRKVILPVEVEPTVATAVLAKGLLTLTLPLKSPKPDESAKVFIKVAAQA